MGLRLPLVSWLTILRFQHFVISTILGLFRHLEGQTWLHICQVNYEPLVKSPFLLESPSQWFIKLLKCYETLYAWLTINMSSMYKIIIDHTIPMPIL